ncbi:uncharacterized protein PHALS_14669 [Plasmopara halstedii]|uniref:Uncharacterized protein n=1 Tax=Plasmopara halstedii TaxID=4781 RepID=A0A0P1ANB8_PLAHL|nr:uncharacterized protein PHALS_14669 [Plasmopara halstedii]CEG42914.1 hypothetical protein PHALS_14669 [Plasmopara halstedii]|eukprot:XP_024579283.1 hypothetical protein PHALS_14669 [Plasmopara halstedii]
MITLFWAANLDEANTIKSHTVLAILVKIAGNIVASVFLKKRYQRHRIEVSIRQHEVWSAHTVVDNSTPCIYFLISNYLR